MTITVTAKSRTISNGTANDATPVDASFTELYNNDQTLANAVNTINSTVSSLSFNYYKFGCIPNYISATSLSVGIGTWVDSTNSTIINVASTLTLNTAVTGALGLDTGTIAANTWYYLWLCNGLSGTTAVLSTSQTTPSMPSGYTLHNRLLPIAIRTDGSNNIIPFYVASGWLDQPLIHYRTLMGDSANPGPTYIGGGNATSNTTISAANFVPPISTKAYLKASIASGSGGVAVTADPVFTSSDIDRSTTLSIGGSIAYYLFSPTDTSQNIMYRVSTSGINIAYHVAGFIVTGVI